MWWIFLLVMAVIIFSWWFLHRDPDRSSPVTDAYVSPADGIVIDVITKPKKKEKIKKKRHGITAFFDDFPQADTIVVIMMKFWHVHTQRAPAGGTVKKLEHKSGTFKNVVFGDVLAAGAENEHVAITSTGEQPWKAYLIAGLVARRIVPLVEKGDELEKGQRIGKIVFGSQVALVLPKVDVLVSEGDRVFAGQTEVAR